MKKQKILAIMAARMGSSRLPGKVLVPILGQPMLGRMIERVRHAKHIDEIVIATTELAEDDALEVFANEIGVGCFRGSVDDVLGRLYGAVASDVDVVVELLGDNPLVHADLIDETIEFYQANEFDYVVTVTNEHTQADAALKRFPIGIRVEVFAAVTLQRCNELANTDYYREHATSFIHKHPDMFQLGFFEAIGAWQDLNRPEISFAVNYPANFAMIEQIFAQCYPDDSNFSLNRALEVFEANSDLRQLMDGFC